MVKFLAGIALSEGWTEAELCDPKLTHVFVSIPLISSWAVELKASVPCWLLTEGLPQLL